QGRKLEIPMNIFYGHQLTKFFNFIQPCAEVWHNVVSSVQFVQGAWPPRGEMFACKGRRDSNTIPRHECQGVRTALTGAKIESRKRKMKLFFNVRKPFFVLVRAGLLFTAIPTFCEAQLQKVTLSYSSSGITSIEFFIAKEKKFFQEEGLEPLLIQMSANTAIAAGVAGELTG